MKEKKEFLRNIHYFRAFAIVNIVFVHVWGLPENYKYCDYTIYSIVNIVKEVIFHDSTIYFIFISGFLFHHLSTNFELKKYYKNKLFNVVFPYVFVTLLIMVFENINFSNPSMSFHISIKKVAYIFIYGKAQIQFWYIPFIVIVFLFSPVFLKIPERFIPYIVVFSSILPLLGTRTGTRISFWQYMYFFPIYLQGIWTSMNYPRVISLVRSYGNYLLFIAIFSTVVLIYLSNGSYRIGLIDIKESFYYLQKIALSFLIIIAFTNIEHRNIPILNILATYSFAIFFTHFLIGNPYFRSCFFRFIPGSSLLLLTASIFYIIIVILLTLMICMGIKRLFGAQSRYLIGV